MIVLPSGGKLAGRHESEFVLIDFGEARWMKLIVSPLKALSGYVSREFYYILNDLITTHGWMHIETHRLSTGSGTIRRTLLKEFGEIPRTILFWEGYDFLTDHAYDIFRLESHKMILADDLHWWNERMRQKKATGFALCDMVLSTYAYVWNRFYPQFAGSKKLVWLPHSASPEFMLRRNEHPENSILLSGAINDHYPLRQQMKALYERRSYPIAYHRHPGYHCGYDHDENDDVGKGYAWKINKHRVGFTDSLRYRYVVAKYFEIPATGALLLADAAVSGPLREIGFEENKHYVPVSKENLEEKIRYVLDEANHEELDEIRRRGQELIMQKHKTSDRAKKINELGVAG